MRVSQIFRDCQTYLFQRTDNLERNRRLEAAKKPVREFLKSYGTEDENGNLVYTFPHPVAMADGKNYAGVMLKAGPVTPYLDEHEVTRLLQGKDPALVLRVYRTITVFDPDELYVLQQEGAISEEQLRGLLHYPEPSYSLWPVEATVPLEGEED